MSSRILITGGRGFIGYHTVRALLDRDSSAEILVYDSDRSYVVDPLPAVERIRQERIALSREMSAGVDGDVLDPDRLRQVARNFEPTHLLHLAAVPARPHSLKEPIAAATINTIGTLHALQAALDVRATLRRFVFVSSSTVYGGTGRAPIAEDGPKNPRDPYAGSKLAGEHLTRTIADTAGMDYVIVRPSSVYGPYESNQLLLQTIFLQAAMSRVIRINEFGHVFDFTFVEDLADGIARATLAPEASGRTLNITRGEGRTVSDVANVLVELFPGLDVDVKRDLKPLATKPSVLDIKAARQVLHYRPRYSLENGLAAYAGFWSDPNNGLTKVRS